MISETSRTWVFRFMLNKRARVMGLGSADRSTLAWARQTANDLRSLLNEGVDPIERQRQTKLEKREAEAEAVSAKEMARTFKECAEEYHLQRKAAWKNAKHAAKWSNTGNDA